MWQIAVSADINVFFCFPCVASHILLAEKNVKGRTFPPPGQNPFDGDVVSKQVSMYVPRPTNVWTCFHCIICFQ